MLSYLHTARTQRSHTAPVMCVCAPQTASRWTVPVLLVRRLITQRGEGAADDRWTSERTDRSWKTRRAIWAMEQQLQQIALKQSSATHPAPPTHTHTPHTHTHTHTHTRHDNPVREEASQ